MELAVSLYQLHLIGTERGRLLAAKRGSPRASSVSATARRSWRENADCPAPERPHRVLPGHVGQYTGTYGRAPKRGRFRVRPFPMRPLA